MNSKQILSVMGALVLTLVVTACEKKAEKPASVSGTSINWMGYTEGMQKAKETGKPVMVDFYTTWCKYCNLLDETTYKNPGIIEMLNRDFVAIKVNAEGTASVTENGKQMTEQQLAAAYKVSGYPTLWLFDKTGKSIGALPGYQSPEELTPVLTYVTSGSYEKGMDYSEYLKTQQKK